MREEGSEGGGHEGQEMTGDTRSRSNMYMYMYMYLTLTHLLDL